MTPDASNRPDRQMELLVSRVLRTGVVVSSAIVLCGGIAYLVAHGREAVSYRTFKPVGDDSLLGLVAHYSSHPGRGTILVGIGVLILTPLARVALSLFGFARAKDRTYTIITAIVMGTLLFGLLSGFARG